MHHAALFVELVQRPGRRYFEIAWLDAKTRRRCYKDTRCRNPVRAVLAYERFLAERGDEIVSAHSGVKVYFIGGDSGPIKIGSSVSPDHRLRGLQTGSAQPLRLLATIPGGRAMERTLHARFAEHRLHGEWFERHPDILAEIDRLSSPAKEPME